MKTSDYQGGKGVPKRKMLSLGESDNKEAMLAF
jgi:hypothetical protein